MLTNEPWQRVPVSDRRVRAAPGARMSASAAAAATEAGAGGSRERDDVLAVLSAAVRAADPGAATLRRLRYDRAEQALHAGERRVELPATGRVLVLGAGKATLRIVEALDELLGARVDGGLAVVRRGQADRTAVGRVVVAEADHPVPSAASVSAARRLLSTAHAARAEDLVISCFTGGSSALASLPPAGVSPAAKRQLHRLLLASGADIVEINAVRKHVSRLKGGRFALAAAPARLLNITVSDVAGDPLDCICDPAVQDTTSVEDAVDVLHRHDLWSRVPRSVRNHLERAATAGTPRLPSDAEALVLTSGRVASAEAAREARRLGYEPLEIGPCSGEAANVARALVSRARVRARETRAPVMLISAGGELTVTLDRTDQLGRGGPNQEAALAAALELGGDQPVAAAFVDTDGADGGLDVAGGVVDGGTAARARAAGYDPAHALAGHATRDALAAAGDAIVTGQSGTNVNDLLLVAARA